MKKIFSFLIAALFSASLFAKQGGTLTATANPINPETTVTLNYDGTGTNFATWTPKCYIHAWLIDKDGNDLGSYATEAVTCNGDTDYEKNVAANRKMTHDGVDKSGKYSIEINIKSFFNVADEDLDKIAALGVSVMTQYSYWEGDNVTNDMYLSVNQIRYYLKNNWGNGDWTWLEMVQDGDNYTLENAVIYGNGGGVNYNTFAKDEGATWVENANLLGDEITALDTVNFVLAPAAGTVTATLVGKKRPVVTIHSTLTNPEWSTSDAFVVDNDPAHPTASLKIKNLTAGSYSFGIKIDGTWRSNGVTITSDDNSKEIPAGDGSASTIIIGGDEEGDYTFTWAFDTNILTVTYPSQGGGTAIDNTEAGNAAVKRLVNGQLVIVKGDKTFNALGAEVK